MKDRIRILIVEDDVFISQDILEWLEEMDYAVSGQAYDEEEAMSQLNTNRPDLVLLDINLGEGGEGIRLGQIIRESHHLPFLYLTSYASKSVLDQAKRTRPQGYVVKPFQAKDLFAAIEIALYNFSERWQPASWKPDYINNILHTDLTRKEVEVLQDIFEGKTNKQLAEKHFVSANTIKTHIRRIYDKLNVHSRTEAITRLRRELSQ